jgi:hypothetical protein
MRSPLFLPIVSPSHSWGLGSNLDWYSWQVFRGAREVLRKAAGWTTDGRFVARLSTGEEISPPPQTAVGPAQPLHWVPKAVPSLVNQPGREAHQSPASSAAVKMSGVILPLRLCLRGMQRQRDLLLVPRNTDCDHIRILTSPYCRSLRSESCWRRQVYSGVIPWNKPW